MTDWLSFLMATRTFEKRSQHRIMFLSEIHSIPVRSRAAGLCTERFYEVQWVTPKCMSVCCCLGSGLVSFVW
jgi:hypothetical protein